MRELQALDSQSLTKALGWFGQKRIDVEALGNVLELWSAQRDDRAHSDFLGHIAIHDVRDADRVRLSQGLQPRGDVHPIAKHIAILLHDVAQMNADADMDLFGSFFSDVVSLELALNLLRALHGVDDRGKVYQEGITNSLDDRAVMFGHSLLDDLIMGFQQP